MPHDLFEGRLVINRVEAWHGLGTVLDRDVDAETAMGLSGLTDVTFSKHPLWVLEPYTNVAERVPDKVALYRDATVNSPRKYLGLCSPNYPIMSNAYLAALVNPLSREWPVESCGAINDGADTFLTLRAGEGTYAGDEHKKFLYLMEPREVGRAMKFGYGWVRMVCKNTVQAGWGSAVGTINVQHRAGRFHADAAWATEVMARMKLTQEKADEIYGRMCMEVVSDNTVAQALAAVFPNPPRPQALSVMDTLASMGQDVTLDLSRGLDANVAQSKERYEQALAVADKNRRNVLALFERHNDEFPRSAFTKYAVMCAVSEYADHRQGNDEYGGGRSRFESAVAGRRSIEKDRAYRYLTGNVAAPA